MRITLPDGTDEAMPPTRLDKIRVRYGRRWWWYYDGEGTVLVIVVPRESASDRVDDIWDLMR
jgi:hypothetical protein